jgi:hypothetical protein
VDAGTVVGRDLLAVSPQGPGPEMFVGPGPTKRGGPAPPDGNFVGPRSVETRGGPAPPDGSLVVRTAQEPVPAVPPTK